MALTFKIPLPKGTLQFCIAVNKTVAREQRESWNSVPEILISIVLVSGDQDSRS